MFSFYPVLSVFAFVQLTSNLEMSRLEYVSVKILYRWLIFIV